MRLSVIAGLSLVAFFSAAAQNYTIATFAGNAGAGAGYSGDTGQATNAQLNSPRGVAVDSSGDVYIADYQNYVIRKVANGVINTIAGNGAMGFVGDFNLATSAELSGPLGVAIDSSGNIYIADAPGPSDRIRKVSFGVITTFAGSAAGFAGDGGPASNASLNYPAAVAIDGAGNIYIADTANNRVRRISSAGIITTIAGNGTPGYNGDNITATSASLFSPQGVAVDSLGNVYIADTKNHRIRKVSGGVITTVAGVGVQGYSGDSGPGTTAQLTAPKGVAIDSTGNLYIADTGNNVVRRIAGGLITTVAGTGSAGYSGDGGPGSKATLNTPTGLAVDPTGGYIYIADSQNNVIRVLTNASATSVVPHFAAGATYMTGFYIINKSNTTASFSILFYNDNGTQISIPVTGIGNTGTISGTVAPLGTAYYEVGDPNNPTLLSGSAQIQASPSVAVQGLFRHLGAGNVYYEAAVPSSTGSNEVLIAFDYTTFAQTNAQIFTGIALANLDSANPATISCTARNSQGTVISGAVTVPTLNPLGHFAGFNFPALMGQQGTLDCTSNTKVGAIALRALGTDAISSLPVITK